MAVTHGHGNPKWTRDETLLALNLYLECGGAVPSKTDERIRELSQLLRSLPYHNRASRKESFRNPDGIGFKLQNIRQIATGKGLGNVSQMDRFIWKELGENPEEVKKLAELIKAGIEITEFSSDEPEDDFEFAEGHTVTEAHKRRERRPAFRKELLARKRKLGALECEICSRIEASTPFGDAIFEAHHTLPLAAGERKTKVSDLALLCANCHRGLHRSIANAKQWIQISEAKAAFEEFKLTVLR